MKTWRMANWQPEGRKAINMAPQQPLREKEKANWEFFLSLPEVPSAHLNVGAIKNSQLLQPLFEFSGACQQKLAVPEPAAFERANYLKTLNAFEAYLL